VERKISASVDRALTLLATLAPRELFSLRVLKTAPAELFVSPTS
jgi:hypothetical protein